MKVPPLRSGAEYSDCLRGRNLRAYFKGKRIAEPVDHPVMGPSINAVSRTYDIANEQPALATAHSSLIGRRVNRFRHVTESADYLTESLRGAGSPQAQRIQIERSMKLDNETAFARALAGVRAEAGRS